MSVLLEKYTFNTVGIVGHEFCVFKWDPWDECKLKIWYNIVEYKQNEENKNPIKYFNNNIQ